MLKIAIIIGSTRPGRKGDTVAQYERNKHKALESELRTRVKMQAMC